MTPTKDQQAQQYADAKVKENYGSESNFEWIHIKQAYSDGYTACEQSMMWRSVDEELPSNDDKVFVIIRGAYVCGWYNQKYESWEIFGMGSYSRKNASYWMPIPPIPETNTEKQ